MGIFDQVSNIWNMTPEQRREMIKLQAEKMEQHKAKNPKNVRNLGPYPAHASGALSPPIASGNATTRGAPMPQPPLDNNTAPSYQDQSMKPHLGSAFPVDGAVQGTNPNAVMMGSDETAGQPSMMDKITGYKPDMGMQQLFEATGKAFGNPLIGTPGVSIGEEYSKLNPAYAEKKRTKLAADKLREQEESQENEKRQYIKMGLESGAITPKHAQRLMALKGVPKGIKDIIEAKTFGNVDNLGTYKGGRILKAPTSKNVGYYLDKETGNTLPLTQDMWLDKTNEGPGKEGEKTPEQLRRYLRDIGVAIEENDAIQNSWWKNWVGAGDVLGDFVGWFDKSMPKPRLEQMLKPIISNNAIQNLKDMRSKKTGATGFGALNQEELALLKSFQTMIDADMDPEILRNNLLYAHDYQAWLMQDKYNRDTAAGPMDPSKETITFEEWRSNHGYEAITSKNSRRFSNPKTEAILEQYGY